MKTYPLITVVVVSWNVADSLKKCLDSIYATRYPELEVIAIDNNSSDKSVKIIESMSSKGITLIKNSGNIGFPKAVNQGLEMGSGDYFLLLNPDARIQKDFFAKALNFFETYPDAGLMGPEIINDDGSLQGSVFPEPSVINYIREFWLGQKGLNSKYTPEVDKPVAVNSVSGSCMFFPRSTMSTVGKFTEEVFMYYEDLDFCRRIRWTGGKVYFNPEITVIHEHGQSALKNPTALSWKGHLWDSSLWYNGKLKHYLLYLIAWSGQKLFTKR